MGVDDFDNKLSTDFSDTSSRAGAEHILVSNRLRSGTSQESINNEEGRDPSFEIDQEAPARDPQSQPWEPDMSSSTWYEAGCFSRYWSHYGFVMAWYRAHMDAVHRLHSDLLIGHGMAGNSAGYYASSHLNGQRFSRNVRNTRRAKRRAR